MISVWWKVVSVGTRYAKYWIPALVILGILLSVYNAGQNAIRQEVIQEAQEAFVKTTRNIGNAVRSSPVLDDARDWLRSFSEREY